ncbi:hypothetical protein NCS55_00651800 [Fusarium keratoplasticum]|nr:hypothetical protein NCS55_00651800 [Fusarium keratoplasticum]
MRVSLVYTGVYQQACFVNNVVTYGSTRFAIYESIKEQSSKHGGGPAPITILLPGAFLSGACGALVGNPADLANVRMQNDRSLPPSLRQNYRSVFDVLVRVAKTDGLQGYLRGVFPNAIRAGAMTGCQLASYDGRFKFNYRNDDRINEI